MPYEKSGSHPALLIIRKREYNRIIELVHCYQMLNVSQLPFIWVSQSNQYSIRKIRPVCIEKTFSLCIAH